MSSYTFSNLTWSNNQLLLTTDVTPPIYSGSDVQVNLENFCDVSGNSLQNNSVLLQSPFAVPDNTPPVWTSVILGPSGALLAFEQPSDFAPIHSDDFSITDKDGNYTFTQNLDESTETILVVNVQPPLYNDGGVNNDGTIVIVFGASFTDASGNKIEDYTLQSTVVPPDNTPPYVKDYQFLSETQIALWFNETMNTSFGELSDTTGRTFTLVEWTNNILVNDVVTFNMNPPLYSSETTDITIQNFKDMALNTMITETRNNVTTNVNPPSQPPVLSLVGLSEITIDVNTPYNEPGASAVDVLGNSLSVSISGTVDTTVAGTYTISYYAVDAYGNDISASRTVIVVQTDTLPPSVTSAIFTSETSVTLNLDEAVDIQTFTGITDADGIYTFTLDQGDTTSFILTISPPLYDFVGPVTLNFNNLADAAGNAILPYQITSTISQTPSEVDVFSSASVYHIRPNTIFVQTTETVTGTPASVDFTVSGKTVTDVQVANGLFQITLQENIVIADTGLTVTYLGSNLQNLQGTLIAPFFDQPITNNTLRKWIIPTYTYNTSAYPKLYAATERAIAYWEAIIDPTNLDEFVVPPDLSAPESENNKGQYELTLKLNLENSDGDSTIAYAAITGMYLHFDRKTTYHRDKWEYNNVDEATYLTITPLDGEYKIYNISTNSVYSSTSAYLNHFTNPYDPSEKWIVIGNIVLTQGDYPTRSNNYTYKYDPENDDYAYWDNGYMRQYTINFQNNQTDPEHPEKTLLINEDGESITANIKICMNSGFRVAQDGISAFYSTYADGGASEYSDEEIFDTQFHEIGHVIGMNQEIWWAYGANLSQFESNILGVTEKTWWAIGTNLELYDTMNPPGWWNITDFYGPRATRAYAQIRNVSPDGQFPPLEDDYGNGSRYSHWDEGTFEHEIMTPIKGIAEGLNAGATTNGMISLLTIAMLEDMGWVIRNQYENQKDFEGYNLMENYTIPYQEDQFAIAIKVPSTVSDIATQFNATLTTMEDINAISRSTTTFENTKQMSLNDWVEVVNGIKDKYVSTWDTQKQWRFKNPNGTIRDVEKNDVLKQGRETVDKLRLLNKETGRKKKK